MKPRSNLDRAVESVTVLVPARNEARHVEKCLAAIAAQDYDLDQIEVLVVDGDSSDGTADRARTAIERLGLHGKVLHNTIGTTPSNLNIGLAHAAGEFVCRVDARSLIPTDYLTRCVDLLSRLADIAVVGGSQVAVPPSRGAVGDGIARALNNRWGMGFSRYRRAAASGVSDTVYLGAFRAADLRAVGGWDERLGTNQDFDLNRRLRRRGAVWFDAALNVGYIPRSDLGDLFRQYRRFGQWKVRYWRMTHDRPRPRQLAILLGAPVVTGATVAVLARSSAKGRLRVLASALVGAYLIDATGSDERASLATRVVALGALACTSTAWLTGVAEELLRGRLTPQSLRAAGRR